MHPDSRLPADGRPDILLAPRDVTGRFHTYKEPVAGRAVGGGARLYPSLSEDLLYIKGYLQVGAVYIRRLFDLSVEVIRRVLHGYHSIRFNA